MGRIPTEELERLKRETDLRALVEGSGVELRRHGSDWLGLCPFHDDSIILTSNKHVRDGPEIFASDEVLTTAILDRLLHHVHIIHIDGRSYRLREIDGLLNHPASDSPANRRSSKDCLKDQVRKNGCSLTVHDDQEPSPVVHNGWQGDHAAQRGGRTPLLHGRRQAGRHPAVPHQGDGYGRRVGGVPL